MLTGIWRRVAKFLLRLFDFRGRTESLLVAFARKTYFVMERPMYTHEWGYEKRQYKDVYRLVYHICSYVLRHSSVFIKDGIPCESANNSDEVSSPNVSLPSGLWNRWVAWCICDRSSSSITELVIRPGWVIAPQIRRQSPHMILYF